MAINALTTMNMMYMNRITGLQSGFDTDTLIRNMMRVQQVKYDKMFQSKTLAEWKRDAYTEVNDALRKFRDEYTSFLSSKNMMTVNAYTPFTVDMPTNAKLSVSAGASAREGSYTVSVEQLAEGASLTGTAASSDGKGLSGVISNTRIGDITFAGGQILTDAQFSINGTNFYVSANDTLKMVMDTINASGAGVTMRYERDADAFVLETTATGSAITASELNVNDTNGFLAMIGLNGTVQGGQNAELTINGVSIERDSNNFDYDGITFRLTETIEEENPVTFTVKRDLQTKVDAIKGFVDAYNNLMTKLYGMMTEKKNYGYFPLTEEQRGDLTEREADLWDAKAKAGLLSRDPALRSLTDKLHSAFTTAIGTDMLASTWDSSYAMVTGSETFSSLGITSTGYKPGQVSLIQIDESKLKAALETDPEKVFKMFTARVEDADGRLIANQSGLIPRLTEAMEAFTITTRDSVGSSIHSLDDSILAWEDKMKAESKRLYNLQESYYKKFTAMEAALAKMQSQTSALGMLDYSYN